jgi:hypothetical protein
MEKDTFEREISMCHKLYHDNGGKCNWGECDKCGVIPILYKLFRRDIRETPEEVEDLKEEVFSKVDQE